MSVKYEDIVRANETIKTTDIKGKDYAEVNQRIKAFRMVYPQGSIPTEILKLEDGIVVMRASVYTEDDKLLGTGTAYEKENSTFINKTSYIENCETSAVGRALGMAGFGIDTSVASAEEIQNAINNQEEIKATKKQIDMLKKYYKGENLDKLLKMNDIKEIADLPIKKASELISEIMKKEEEATSSSNNWMQMQE